MAAPHTGMTQLINGNFQDANGDALNAGYLIMQLNQDAQSSQQSQVDGNRSIKITLDATGNAVSGQYVWPNTALNPSTTYYIVSAYSAAGQLVWGPNYLLVNTVPTFDLDSWVPNQIGGGGVPTGSITLQTNGVNNGSQQLLDLQQGTNVTITDNGSGVITIASAGGSGPRSRGWSGWVTDGADGPTPNAGQGCTPNFSLAGGGVYTGVSPTATETKMLKMNTSASSGSITGFTDNGDSHTADSVWTLGILGLCEHRAKISDLTNIRFWVGGENGYKSGQNFWKSDAPALPTVAFRYSTAAGDTHWMCVVTDGTTQVVADSGVNADTNGHVFGIQFSAGHVLFILDGVQVASVAIATTTLTTSSAFCGFVSVDNVSTANDRSYSLAYSYWDTSP